MQIENEKESREARFEKLVESLELVTARMIETAVVNSQLASSQTPEMRRLFDTWLECVSGEAAKFFSNGGEVDLAEISKATGLPRDSALALLVSLDRMGKITIHGLKGEAGDGKNRGVCDCLLR